MKTRIEDGRWRGDLRHPLSSIFHLRFENPLAVVFQPEADAEPAAPVAPARGIDLMQRPLHRRQVGKTIDAGVGVAELIEPLDRLDRLDDEPAHPGRKDALPGSDARGGPAAKGRPLAPAADRVPETFFEKELSHELD